MDWNMIWETASTVIISVGGAGAIILASAKFLAEKTANRLEAKFQQKLDKGIEKYKSTLEHNRYITKTQFDIEFGVYRKLTKTYFDMLVSLTSIVGDDYRDTDPGELHKRKCDINTYKRLIQKNSYAQDTLYENAPFIPETMFKKYEEILELANKQFWVFIYQFREHSAEMLSQGIVISDSDKANLQTIKEKINDVNSKLRDYLNSLNIVD
jgi:hypothetical protein